MHEGDFRSRPSGGIWHSLNRFVFTLIILSSAVPIGYSFLPEVQKRKEQDLRVEELKAEIEKQRMILARFQREENLLKHDPEYVGLVARDRLNMMKPGETIYRLDVPKPAPSTMRLKQ
ncbi:MAG TPA: septum formation initiator family protein [Chthoniobacteraceae bacterium]